jgi:hypothetical protein
LSRGLGDVYKRQNLLYFDKETWKKKTTHE